MQFTFVVQGFLKVSESGSQSLNRKRKFAKQS
jgi:hypothetical protein